MDDIIAFFLSMTSRIANFLDTIGLNMYGLYISWFDLIISFTALCIIIAVFWRGVRK